MEDARLLEDSGAPGGSVVWADFQTEGRGRLAERRWVSPPGGALLATFFWHEQQFRVPQFAPSLLVALGVVDWLCQYPVPGRFCVKWPNDVLYEAPEPGFEAFKLAGILTIVRWRSKTRSIHVGVGVNLQPPPEGLYRRAAGSLAALDITLTPSAALQQLMFALEQAFQDPDPRCRLETHLWKRGDEATWEAPSGEKLTGVVEGLTVEGHLLLRTAAGMRTVTSGE